MGKSYYSSGQLAKICGVTKYTILTAIRNGELPSNQTPGGHHRIMEPAALIFMQKYRVRSELVSGLPGKTVLLWGEDREIRSAAAELLRRPNVSVLNAENLFEAGMLFERAKPRLVVLTVGTATSRENLESLLRQLHEKSRLAKTKILVLGPECTPEERAKLHLAGIHGFLNISISADDLAKRVDELFYGQAVPAKQLSANAPESEQSQDSSLTI